MECSRTEREYQIQLRQVSQAPKDRLKSSSEELCTLDKVPKRELLESQTYELNDVTELKRVPANAKRYYLKRKTLPKPRTNGNQYARQAQASEFLVSAAIKRQATMRRGFAKEYIPKKKVFTMILSRMNESSTLVLSAIFCSRTASWDSPFLRLLKGINVGFCRLPALFEFYDCCRKPAFYVASFFLNSGRGDSINKIRKKKLCTACNTISWEVAFFPKLNRGEALALLGEIRRKKAWILASSCRAG